MTKETTVKRRSKPSNKSKQLQQKYFQSLFFCQTALPNLLNASCSYIHSVLYRPCCFPEPLSPYSLYFKNFPKLFQKSLPPSSWQPPPRPTRSVLLESQVQIRHPYRQSCSGTDVPFSEEGREGEIRGLHRCHFRSSGGCSGSCRRSQIQAPGQAS